MNKSVESYPISPYCVVNVDDLYSWITFVAEQLNNKRRRAVFRKNEFCGETWIYRGQSNAEWEITSTLQREIKVDTTQIKSFEHDMRGKELAAILNFKSLAWKFVPDPKMTRLEWLMLMRHYGFPTRLVDFSESPSVALHFAVEKEPCTDFAVWAVNRDKFRDAYIQSQVGSKLPGWKELTMKYGDQVMSVIENIESCDPIVRRAQDYLLNFILSDATIVMRNAFNRDLANEILNTSLSCEPSIPEKMGVLWFTPAHPSPRMIAQRGLFLLPLRFSEPMTSSMIRTFEINGVNRIKGIGTLHISDKDLLKRITPQVNMFKFVFKHEMLDEVKDFLQVARCSSSNLYPDIDGVAEEVKNQMQKSLSGYVGSLCELGVF